MAECRAKLEKNIDILDEKDLQALRDDVQFFTAENHESTVKAKALVLRNAEQALKIKELSQKHQAVLKKSMMNLDMSSILLDAIDLGCQQQTRKSDHLDFFQPSSTGKPNSQGQDPEDNNVDDLNLIDGSKDHLPSNRNSEVLSKSAIHSLVSLDADVDDIGQQQTTADKLAANNNEDSAETSSGDQQVRLSRIERMIDEQRINLGEASPLQ